MNFYVYIRVRISIILFAKKYKYLQAQSKYLQTDNPISKLLSCWTTIRSVDQLLLIALLVRAVKRIHIVKLNEKIQVRSVMPAVLFNRSAQEKI